MSSSPSSAAPAQGRHSDPSRGAPPSRRSHRSHLRTALGSRANRHALVVTAAVGAVVLLASQRPLPRGFEIDLRERGFGERAPVSLVGFGEPTETGRRLGAAGHPRAGSDARGEGGVEGRVRLHRPLPDAFTLVVEAASERRGRPERMELRVGDRRYPLRFDGGVDLARVEVEGAGSARELVFRARSVPARDGPRRSAVSLRRLILQ